MGMIKKKEFKLDNGEKWTVNVEMYSSAQDVVNDGRNRKITNSSFDDMMKHCGSESFTSVKSYDEALELMKNGYQPTVEQLSGALKVNANGIEKRIKFENNIHGFAPIVPLALKGVPNSMMNMTMKPIKCKVIDVYYDMTINCGVSTETIIENGQKILGAIIALEKQGYRFNLYAVQTYCRDRDTDMLCVKVKSSDKPLDLKRMSFPLTHPAFFRVIGFDWYSKCPTAKYKSGYGHAVAYELNRERRADFGKKMFGDGAIYLSCKDVTDENEETLKGVFTNAESKN